MAIQDHKTPSQVDALDLEDLIKAYRELYEDFENMRSAFQDVVFDNELEYDVDDLDYID